MTPEQEAQQAQTVADRKKRDAESWERYLHEQSRSYPEDLLDIDHGAYRNDCSTCGKPFQGFKRRFTCRVCEIANLKAIVDSQAQKIAEQAAELNVTKTMLNDMNEICSDQAKELKLLRYVLEAEKTARIYEDGTGAAGEALFHARKELENYDAKMTPDQTTDSKEVAR